MSCQGPELARSASGSLVCAGGRVLARMDAVDELMAYAFQLTYFGLDQESAEYCDGDLNIFRRR